MWSSWWLEKKQEETVCSTNAQGQPRVCSRPAVLGRALPSLWCFFLVLWLQFRHLLQTVSLKGMCSWVLFHFYFSDVWSGSFSGLAFLYLNLLSLLARGGRNVQTLEKDTLWQQNFFLWYQEQHYIPSLLVKGSSSPLDTLFQDKLNFFLSLCFCFAHVPVRAGRSFF